WSGAQCCGCRRRGVGRNCTGTGSFASGDNRRGRNFERPASEQGGDWRLEPKLRSAASTIGFSAGVCAVMPLSEKNLTLLDAYWRAANYLSVGQIYLRDNPL